MILIRRGKEPEALLQFRKKHPGIGYEDMGKQAVELGANTFAFFTRNPRGGSIKALDVKDAKRFVEFAKENNFGKIENRGYP